MEGGEIEGWKGGGGGGKTGKSLWFNRLGVMGVYLRELSLDLRAARFDLRETNRRTIECGGSSNADRGAK